jgi:hypothetical protein
MYRVVSFDLLVSRPLRVDLTVAAVPFCFGQALGRADAEVAAELRHWRGARADARAHYPCLWRTQKMCR